MTNPDGGLACQYTFMAPGPEVCAGTVYKSFETFCGPEMLPIFQELRECILLPEERSLQSPRASSSNGEGVNQFDTAALKEKAGS